MWNWARYHTVTHLNSWSSLMYFWVALDQDTKHPFCSSRAVGCAEQSPDMLFPSVLVILWIWSRKVQAKEHVWSCDLDKGRCYEMHFSKASLYLIPFPICVKHRLDPVHQQTPLCETWLGVNNVRYLMRRQKHHLFKCWNMTMYIEQLILTSVKCIELPI